MIVARVDRAPYSIWPLDVEGKRNHRVDSFYLHASPVTHIVGHMSNSKPCPLCGNPCPGTCDVREGETRPGLSPCSWGAHGRYLRPCVYVAKRRVMDGVLTWRAQYITHANRSTRPDEWINRTATRKLRAWLAANPGALIGMHGKPCNGGRA